MKNAAFFAVCLLVVWSACAGAADAAPKMKSRWPDLLRKFELSQSSSSDSSSAPRAANSTGTLSVKEKYSDVVTFDTSFGTDYAANATLKGTLALTNGNGSKVTAATVFTITAGSYTTKFVVGDDPKFKDKSKKASRTPESVDLDFNGKTKKVKATLTVSWTPDNLKFTIVTAGDASNGVGAVFAVLRKTPSSLELNPPPVTVQASVPVTVSFGSDSAAFSISGSGSVIDTDVNEGLPNGGSKIVHTVDYTASGQ